MTTDTLTPVPTASNGNGDGNGDEPRLKVTGRRVLRSRPGTAQLVSRVSGLCMIVIGVARAR